MSLRSNATPSGNAQRINDTAGMGLHNPYSPWHSYALRGLMDTGSQRCEANELANPNITHALRKAGVEAQAPLRSCCSGPWAGSGSMDQLGRLPLRVFSIGKYAFQKKRLLGPCPDSHADSATEWHYHRVFAIFPTKAALAQLA
jgi:hypothetical protein